MEPAFLEIRQGQDRSVSMSCRVLRAYPIRVLTYEWRLGNKLLRTGQFDSQEYTEYPVKSLSNENYGVYNCSIINEAGAGRCSFLVTGKIPNISLSIFLCLLVLFIRLHEKQCWGMQDPPDVSVKNLVLCCLWLAVLVTMRAIPLVF